MRRLHAFWFVWLTTSVFAAEPADLPSETRLELLEMAERWGVPQPQADSTLMKIWVYGPGVSNDNFSATYVLGFVEPCTPNRALVGFEYLQPGGRDDAVQAFEPSELTLEGISLTSSAGAAHGINFGLLTGIQLLRRGDEEVGAALIAKALHEEAGHYRSPFYSPAGEPPVLMLARSCLGATLNEIKSSKPDFPRIKERIERLLTDQPALKSAATDWVLDSLEANIAHKPGAPGSMEQIVDDYLFGGGVEGAGRWPGEFTQAERTLILKGFDAIPSLLEQRHSRRFTNHIMQALNNSPSYVMSAGQVIDHYLQRFANAELGTDWLERQQGYTAHDEAVLTWWEQASAVGEEEYVRTHTVIIYVDEEVQLSHELLLVAEHKYPALLPRLYETLLETSHSSWSVARALAARATISREAKIELFQTAVAANHEAHRNTALFQLQELDAALTDEILIQLLNKAPSSPDGEYWTDQDAELGELVSKSQNVEVWQTMLAFLGRANLGMQMELIHHLLPPHDAPPGILRFFDDIYEMYSNDKTIRDESTSWKFSGPGAGFPHNKIEMRDFIHVHWARWLELELEEPKNGASPQEWRAYRAAVRPAIQRFNAEHDVPGDFIRRNRGGKQPRR